MWNIVTYGRWFLFYFVGILHAPINITNEFWNKILKLTAPQNLNKFKIQKFKLNTGLDWNGFTVCETLGSILFIFVFMYMLQTGIWQPYNVFFLHILYKIKLHKYTKIQKKCRYIYITSHNILIAVYNTNFSYILKHL